MTGRVVQFPRPPLRPDQSPRWNDGRVIDRCDDPLHVFATVPGRCQCGEHLWEAPAEEDE